MAMGDIGPGGDVRLFLAVCDHGGFARAAGSLGLTASAVAKGVARLEGRIGVRLFERSTRHFRITPEGEHYRAVCRAAVGSVRAVEEALALSASEPAGLVRVTLPPLLGAEIVAPALFALTDQHPRLSLNLSLDRTPVDLRGGQVDLAIRIGDPPDVAGVIGRRIGVQRLALCASADYIAARGAPAGRSDLQDHELIATAIDGRPAPWRFTEAGREVVWAPPARLILDGAALALSAIRAGRGVGLIPSWVAAADIASGRLMALMPDAVTGHRPIYALWPDYAPMLPRLRVVIDAAAAALRQATDDGGSPPQPTANLP
ncbi:LysR family transcriptional regulator [Brevundimonas nasdae]|uniref:LysR family transcriptional regulator n=1 Tax=Brevundimonas nasdae TaxID=172043 RepID=UPI003F68CB26